MIEKYNIALEKLRTLRNSFDGSKQTHADKEISNFEQFLTDSLLSPNLLNPEKVDAVEAKLITIERLAEDWTENQPPKVTP